MSDFGTCKENTAAQFRLPTTVATNYVFKIGSRHCAAAFSWQVPKSCIDLDPTLLYILILRTRTMYQIRTEKWNASARRLLQTTLLDNVRMFAASRSCLNYHRTNRFVSTRTNSIKCFVSWIPMHTHVRANKTQLCLKAHERERVREIDGQRVISAHLVDNRNHSYRIFHCAHIYSLKFLFMTFFSFSSCLFNPRYLLFFFVV